MIRNTYSRFLGGNLVSIVTMIILGVAGMCLIALADDSNETVKFQRIATFPVFENTCLVQSDDCVDTKTVAEIVTSSSNGRTLIYTDNETENIGFVDITNPSSPQPAGLVAVGGEPTSVAVAGNYALASINTSTDFVNTSGLLQIIHIMNRSIVRTINLGGQPDAIAVSPDGRYAAVAIENERDEDLDDGRPPQLPEGFLVIVDLTGLPTGWSTRTVPLVGRADRFPEDPEPEFVDINHNNVAVVTLQENNHLVLVDLPTGYILNDFSAGDTDLFGIDTQDNDLIEPNSNQFDRLREPDAVAWLGNHRFATADEGDLDGGSRGFTIFDINGNVVFNAGTSVEQLVTRLGHYAEDWSENNGNEPEGIEYGSYDDNDYLFVGSERSNVVAVFNVDSVTPELVQTLPTGVGPEGLLAIPNRNLFVVASEVDDRGNKIRSSLTIYSLVGGDDDNDDDDGESIPTYPTIQSADRPDGSPIPWGALFALAGDSTDSTRAYTVYDSSYKKSRIFPVDVSVKPALITDEIVLNDHGATLDLDHEGIATRLDGSFWIVSEGAGSVDDPNRPVTSLNLLLQVNADGAVQQTIQLPAATNALQRRFGFDGVASVGQGANEVVYVAFQREWVGDPVG